MEALLPLLLDLGAPAHSPVEPSVLDASGLENFIHHHTLSEDEMEDHMRLFDRHCERLDWPLTQEQEEKNFARFFSLMQEALLSEGSFSECRLDDADFTSRSDADPTHVLRVRSTVLVSQQLAVSTMSACLFMKSEYAVIFDTRDGRSVLFGNGDFVQVD